MIQPAPRFLLAVMVGLCCFMSHSVQGVTVLRVGPFDFSAGTFLEMNYTTNVDGVRPSQTDLEQEDIYFRYGLSLGGTAQLGPETRLDLVWALDWERHINRSDLDTENDRPLGRGRITLPLALGPALRSDLFAFYDRSLETRETAFAGGTRSKRDPNTVAGFGADLRYSYNRVNALARYASERERHDLVEFKDGDEDREGFGFQASYAIWPRVRGVYEFNRERSDLLQREDDFTGNEDSYGIGLDVDLWLRPRVVYSFRYEREDKEGERGEWEPTHTITVGEGVPLYEKPNLTLVAFASYKFERNPDDDDVAFQYGLRLSHQINPWTAQTLTMRREPVDTLGSKADTTVTDWVYRLTRSHFLLPRISLAVGLGYSINEPADPSIPDEDVLSFDVSVAHSRQITPRLGRSLVYRYSAEDSTLETELLEEHRLTLLFNLTF